MFRLTTLSVCAALLLLTACASHLGSLKIVKPTTDGALKARLHFANQ